MSLKVYSSKQAMKQCLKSEVHVLMHTDCSLFGLLLRALPYRASAEQNLFVLPVEGYM